MKLPDLLRGFVFLYLKFIIAMALLLVTLQMFEAWWRSIRLSPAALLTFFVVAAAASLTAYFVRERRRPRGVRTDRRHGAERTPLLPQNGGGEW